MDGKDSAGRKISLLNTGSDVALAPTKAAAAHHRHHHRQQHHHHHHHHHQHSHYPYRHPSHLPSLTARSRSSSSSCTSSPSLSPQTPLLERSDSNDSRGFATPSPLTPSAPGFDHAAANIAAAARPQHPLQHYYFATHRAAAAKMDDHANSLYPPIPDATSAIQSAYPMPPPMVQQQLPPHQAQIAAMYRSSNSPASEPSHVSTVSAASAGATKPLPKKNQYPCPMAKQVGCTDFFTTSGHAARHAKKHTGKKDAYCPECNKAFTRKDNMEQHRRTHQNGRATASRASDDKVKKTSTKPPAAAFKKSAVAKSDQPAFEVAVEQQMAEQQHHPISARLQAAAQVQAQVAAAQQQQHQAQTNLPPQQKQQQPLQLTDSMLIPPPAGPYFLSTIDTGPIPPLPMPPMIDAAGRPPLLRSNVTNSLDFLPSVSPMDPETLNYSYPSPGLSNGLNSLALAASEHRRLAEANGKSPSSDSCSSSGSP